MVENLQMNITRKNKILFLFLLTCLISCNLKKDKDKSKEIQINFSKEWKLDTLGCLGIRQKIVLDSLDEIKQFIGSSSEMFFKSFGNPYSTKAKEKEKMYLYWISCCEVPLIKGVKSKQQKNQINTESTHLIVEVDSTEIIESIKIFLP